MGDFRRRRRWAIDKMTEVLINGLNLGFFINIKRRPQVHVYSIEGTGAYGPLLLAAAQGFGEALRASRFENGFQ